MDLFDQEPRDGFARNFLVVLGVHAALLGALWLVSRAPRESLPEQITWLDGGAMASGGASETEPSGPAEAPLPPAPILEPDLPPVPDDLTAPAPPPPPEPAPVKPEPDALAVPKPTPKPEPTPRPTPKPTATPQKRSTPTPKPAKITPKPLARISKSPPKVTTTPKPSQSTAAKSTGPAPERSVKSSATAGNAGAGNGAGTGPAGGTAASGTVGPGAPNGSAAGSLSAAEKQNYYSAVGESFRATWNLYKPLVGEGTGGKLTALVRVRISSSGAVLQATLTRPTGNREVDTSIERSFGDFKTVPAPPAMLLKGSVFEENIAVILSI